MSADRILGRAHHLLKMYCAEDVFITGKDAMVCHGILEQTHPRSDLYLRMPAICRNLLRPNSEEVECPRFSSVLKIKDSVGLYVLSGVVDLKESGRFTYLGEGIWIETLESYLREYDPDYLNAVKERIRKINTE